MRLTDEMLQGPLAESWQVVAQYFGPSSAVVDNIVETKDRQHFYRLEDVGLLRSLIREERLPSEEDGRDGKPWRVFWWVYEP
jgi:hypothetical protein